VREEAILIFLSSYNRLYELRKIKEKRQRHGVPVSFLSVEEAGKTGVAKNGLRLK